MTKTLTDDVVMKGLAIFHPGTVWILKGEFWYDKKDTPTTAATHPVKVPPTVWDCSRMCENITEMIPKKQSTLLKLKPLCKQLCRSY